MTLGPGSQIGDWIIDGPLGAGGMGSVYRCHNALAPRILAAVKVVHPDPAQDFAQRFVHEVEALESLQHPAVVRVKGWGQTEGMLWLAMDLVEGEDLRERLQRGPLHVDEATAVFRALAAGLAHAHGREVFHRDIKPANVVLGDDGTARIVDFGIAIHDGRTRLSSAGMIPGTPAYLAPEVFGGSPQPRALDVYAFGQLLYEALSGELAFPEPQHLTTTQAIAHVAGRKLQAVPLDPGPTIPDALRAIVRATTHPDPRRRLLDLDQVVAAFDGAPLPEVRASETLDFDPDAIEPVFVAPVDEPPAPPLIEVIPPRPSPARVIAVLSLPVLLLGLVGALWWNTGPDRHDVEIAVTGLDPSIPSIVWLDGAELQGAGGLYRAETEGEATLVARAGRFCELDSESCGPCCSCAEVTSDRDSILVSMAPPPSPEVVIALQPPNALAQVRLGDRAGARDPAGIWHFTDVAPGTYAIEATIGTCPASAANCGVDCPPGCSSVVQGIDVTCAGDNQATVAIPTPPVLPGRAMAPAPPVASALRGKRVKLIYARGERAVAERIESLVRARGGSTELQLIETEPRQSFGRLIPFGPQNTEAATELARLASGVSLVRTMPPSKSELELDLVLWVASNE